MAIRNVMENVVKGVISKHKHQLHLNCDCDRCLDDITAISLNKLPPRYIVNEEHNPYVRAMHEADSQGVMNILMIVAQSATIVSNNPRCGITDSAFVVSGE